jgi:hypothetical protein
MSESPPTTPPSNAAPLPAGTPVHTHSATIDQYNYEDGEATFQQLSDEMKSFFVSPVPPQEFLDHFLPSTSPDSSGPAFKAGMFTNLSGTTSEAEMYTKCVSSNLCPASD